MKRTSALASQPPIPSDPMVCRWCRCRRLQFSDGDTFCQQGCAANDSAPYLGHCQDCGSDFLTGAPLIRSVLCWPCDSRESREYAAAYAGTVVSGYLRDRIRRGANRQVMARLEDREQ